MTTFEIGSQVKVTLDRIGQEALVFVSTVMDDGGRTDGVWVDHPECRGEDMLFINLSNPNVNKVELVQDEIEVTTEKEIKEIKKDLLKSIKYEDNVSIAVKVYDCSENDEQTYDVEINYYIDGEYTDGFYNQTFHGRFEGDELAEKQAVKRAKAVLRTVKGWFENNDDVTVLDGVEVYHA